MYSNLATGLHTFEVRAIAGEIGAFEGDPTPARYTWRVGPDPDNPSETPLDCDQANISLTASAFFRFPFQNDAPHCVLESATLRLYAGGHTEARTLVAVPLEDTWKESSLTWANQPDPYPGAAAATTESGETYRERDVKAHVEAIRTGTFQNHGWVIRDQHESDTLEGGDQSFLSREMPQDPPEVTLPELELRYVAAGSEAPPPPPEPAGETVVHCGQVITESTRLA